MLLGARRLLVFRHCSLSGFLLTWTQAEVNSFQHDSLAMADVLHRNSLFGGSKGSQSSIMVIAKASEDDVDEAREDQPLLGDRYPRVTDDEHGGDVGSGHQLNMISISVLLLGTSTLSPSHFRLS